MVLVNIYCAMHLCESLLLSVNNDFVNTENDVEV